MSEEYTDEHAEPLDPPRDEATEPSTEAPDRAGGKDLLKVLGIVWFTEIVLGIAVMTVSSMIGGESARPGGTFIDWRVMLVAFSMSSAVVIWACWCFSCERYGRSLRDGLYLVPVSTSTLGVSAVIGIIASGIGIGVSYLSPSEEMPMVAELFVRPSPDQPGVFELIYPMLFLPILAAVVEEVYYRGFLYAVFQRLLNENWAFLIISAWFGLIHAPQIAGNWSALASVMMVSIVLTALRRKYQSIWPTIVCHVTYNGVLMLAMALLDVEQ